MSEHMSGNIADVLPKTVTGSDLDRYVKILGKLHDFYTLDGYRPRRCEQRIDRYGAFRGVPAGTKPECLGFYYEQLSAFCRHEC